MADQPRPFTRLQHPDRDINRIVQDIYDKLQQIQAEVSKIQQALPPAQ